MYTSVVNTYILSIVKYCKVKLLFRLLALYTTYVNIDKSLYISFKLYNDWWYKGGMNIVELQSTPYQHKYGPKLL